MSEDKSIVILREKDSGKFYQTFLIGELVDVKEKEDKVVIGRVLRCVQDILTTVKSYAENGQPKEVEYGVSSLFFPDVILTNTEKITLRISDFLYVTVIDESQKHDLAEAYKKQLTDLRMKQAGLHKPEEKKIHLAKDSFKEGLT